MVGACVRLLPFLSSLCSQDAGLVGACVPWLPFCLGCRVGGAWVLSYRFSQCLCSLIAVLVGLSSWLPFWSVLVFPGCRFGRCVCLMVAALVYACVPSCLFNRCLCSPVAVLVGMSSSHILLYWAPAPQKGRIKAQMTFPFTGPGPR